jgi:hypothetical protein
MTTQAKLIAMLATILAVLVMIAQGCDLRQFVSVDAPRPVLESLDLEGPITLAQADVVYEDWVSYVRTNTDRFEASIEAANDRYRFVHEWVSMGISAAGEAAGGVPFGALAFGALTGAAGLMLPQPKLARKRE